MTLAVFALAIVDITPSFFAVRLKQSMIPFVFAIETDHSSAFHPAQGVRCCAKE